MIIFKPFNPDIIEEEVIVDNKQGKVTLFLAIIFLVTVMFVSSLIINYNKNESKMEDLVQYVEMDNNNILTKKVIYETFKKIDPSDTSDVFFMVVNDNDEKYSKGTLIKFNHRFIQEQQIEGNIYCIIEKSQIQFYIKPENVKESLLKR
jgi:hypothetical protein